MKQYLGIIITVVYAVVIRLLAEFDVFEINSLSFFVITPIVLAFIPFLFRNDRFYSSVWKAIVFPLVSIFLFLLIMALVKIEDFFCLIIIGMPYILIIVVLSVALYYILKKKEDGISKNMFSILLIPIVLGSVEKQFPKESSEFVVSEKIIINTDAATLYGNLLAVPNLETANYSGISNYLGVPRPLYSTYDKESNVRKGYFENAIVLYETVEYSETNSKLVFKIDVAKSELKNSPTLQHILTKEGVEFININYELFPIDTHKTELKLSTTVQINSNLNFYGKYWSELIITDFEKNILYSLKHNLEKE